MTVLTVRSIGESMRDLFPLAGQRIKQWVVEQRREEAWTRATCPVVVVHVHHDDSEALCARSGSDVQWYLLDDHECQECSDLQEATSNQTDVEAWLRVRASRPPITRDHVTMSDEIEGDSALQDNPLLALLRKPTRP